MRSTSTGANSAIRTVEYAYGRRRAVHSKGMDPFGLGYVCALLVAVLWFGVYWRLTALDKGWRDAAKTLGLAYEPRRVFRRPRIKGRIGTNDVLVDITDPSGTDHFEHVMTRVRVSAPQLPSGFEVGAKSVWSRMAQRLWAKSASTGDGRFDQQVKIDGDETYALAVLSPAVRERLHRLTTLSGYVHDGDLIVTVRGHIRSASRIVQLVDFLIALAADLSLPEEEWASALRTRAIEDPSAEIRRRSLEALVRGYPDSVPARGAVQNRLIDFVPEIRLLAAQHAGEGGINTASEVFHDAHLDPSLRIRALEVWAELAPRRDEPIGRAIVAALASPVEAMIQAGARVVATRKEEGVRTQVLQVIAKGPPSAHAAALAALGAIADARDLETVTDGLKSKDPDVRVAAAEAMGQLGGRETVEYLLPLTRGLGQPARVKDAARAAVASIQARTGGDRGGLSLVDRIESGGLSIPGEGSVSVVDE